MLAWGKVTPKFHALNPKPKTSLYTRIRFCEETPLLAICSRAPEVKAIKLVEGFLYQVHVWIRFCEETPLLAICSRAPEVKAIKLVEGFLYQVHVWSPQVNRIGGKWDLITVMSYYRYGEFHPVSTQGPLQPSVRFVRPLNIRESLPP